MQKSVRCHFSTGLVWLVIMIPVVLLIISGLATADQNQAITISAPRSNQHLTVLPIEFRLRFGISIEQGSFQATVNGKTVTDRFQFTNSSGKATLSISDGIRPGRNRFSVTVKNQSGARFRSTRSFVIEVPNVPQLSGTIGTQGGSVILPEIAKVSFPSGSFANDQNVTLSVSTDPRIDAAYLDSTSLFGVSARSPYELTINTGSVQPEQSFGVQFNIPSTLRKLTKGNRTKIALFGESTWKNDLESHDTFELFATLDSNDEPFIEAVLPDYLFSKTSDDGSFKTVITLGIVPAAESSGASLPLAGDSCPRPEVELFPPLIPLPKPSSAFGTRKDPKTGKDSTPHYGVDYPSDHKNVYAMADGTIKHAGVGYSGLFEGFGIFIILEHKDGGSSLYGHLATALFPVGKSVTAGTVIGISDNTGKSTGPHLHVEYNTGSGRVDPAACIKQPERVTITLYGKCKLTCDGEMIFCSGACDADKKWCTEYEKGITLPVERNSEGYVLNFIEPYPSYWYSYVKITQSDCRHQSTDSRFTNRRIQVKPFGSYCVDLSAKLTSSIPCDPLCEKRKGFFMREYQYSNFRPCGGASETSANESDSESELLEQLPFK